jgi:HSP20 family protein
MFKLKIHLVHHQFAAQETTMSETATKVPVKTEKPMESKPAIEGRPLQALRQQVDRLFEDFQRGYWHLPFSQKVFDVEPFWRGDITFGATPSVDIIEKDDGYKVTAELPGMAAGDIEVKFSDGMLMISGEKQEDKEEKKKDYFLSERHYGSFKRSFRVAEGVDPDKIEATFKNGVLTVTLPKTAEARKKTKTIAVKAA